MSELPKLKDSIFSDFFKKPKTGQTPPVGGLASAYKAVHDDSPKGVSLAEAIERARAEHVEEIRAALKQINKEQPMPTPLIDEHSKNPFTAFFRNFGKISHLWPQFIACLFLLALGEFLLLEYVHSGSDKAKDAEIALLSLRPPVPEKEYEDLKSQLSVLQGQESARESREWSPMTEVQIARWVELLRPYKPVSLTVYYEEPNGYQMFQSLKEIGRRLKIPATRGSSFAGGSLVGFWFQLPPKHDDLSATLDQLLRDLGPTVEGKGDPLTNPDIPLNISIEIGDRP